MTRKESLEFVTKKLDRMIKSGFDCVTHGELLKLERRISTLEKEFEKLRRRGK